MPSIALPAASGRRPGREWTVDARIGIVILIAAIAIRIPYFGDPAPDYDEQLYSFIGQRMLVGDIPYVDLWDRKPLGIFLIYALAHWLGGPGAVAYQTLAIASAALGGWLTYKLATRLGGTFAAAVAGLLYLLNLSLFGAAIGQSEVFYVPLLLLMLEMLCRVHESRTIAQSLPHATLLMVIGGLALQIKYTVLPQCLFFGIAALWRLWRLGMEPRKLALAAAIFGAIGILPTLAVTVGYFAIGHGAEFIYANFVSIFSRGALTGDFALDYKLRVALAATPLILLALAGGHQARRGQRWPKQYTLVLGWTAAALASFLMIGNIYVHYFAPVTPGLILLAVPLFDNDRMGRRIGIIAIATAAVASGFQWQYPHSVSNRAAIEKLTALTAPHVGKKGDCLYVFDGPTALYGTTHACHLSRFVYPDHLSNAMEAPALGVDAADEVRRILDARPAVIVTASEPIVPRYNMQTARLVNTRIVHDYVRTGGAFFYPRMLYVNVRRDLSSTSQPSRVH